MNGRWTKSEHERFMKGLERYGRDWVSVQKVVKSRSLIQVRSHAQKVFFKMSESEISALIGQPEEFETSMHSDSSNDQITEQKIETEKKNLG